MNTKKFLTGEKNKKQTIAIFCRSLEAGGDPFSSDYYWQAYQDLLFALKDRNIAAYFVTDNNSYLGHGVFSQAYTCDFKTPIDQLTIEKNVTVDLVFDRGGFIGRDVLTINDSYIMNIANNKIRMYEHFPELQPFSIVCSSEAELENACTRIESEKIVVKDPEGSGGYQVYIGERAEVLKNVPRVFPLLVQEFLDTSAGIPGVMSGVHDVRISVCGGKLVGYYIRQAKAGALHSNVSQGGTMLFKDPSEIPADVQAMVHVIDQKFQDSPRYYAADFMLTPKGWKMLELNPYLALIPLTDGPEAERTTGILADYLSKLCESITK